MLVLLAALIILLLPQAQSHLDSVTTTPITFYGQFNGISTFTKPLNWTNTAIVQHTPSTIKRLAQLGPAESVNSICSMDVNGTQTIFIGGSFARIGAVESSNVIMMQNETFVAMGRGLDGTVRSVLCDEQTKTVFLAGEFRTPIPEDTKISPYTWYGIYGGGVIRWQEGMWRAVPGRGVAGVAHTAVVSADEKKILVGGEFKETADGVGALDPSAQPVSLRGAEISASSGSPNSIVCGGNGQPWVPSNNATSTWNIMFPYPITLTMLRLKNIQMPDRSTVTFSVGNPQPITLRYFDTRTQNFQTCVNCPLHPSLSQDFLVVKNDMRLAMGLAVNIKEVSGLGGGLSKIDFFGTSVIVSGDDEENASICAHKLNRVQVKGPWQLVPVESRRVLQLKTPSDNDSAEFRPYVAADGNYAIWLYIPSCSATNSCGQQTQSFKVKIEHSETEDPITVTIPNNATTIKIYSGTLSRTTVGFQPKVIISKAASGVIELDRIELIKLPSAEQLNGLVVYDRFGYAPATPLITEAIDPIIVTSIASTKEATIVGGVIKNRGNIVLVKDGKISSFPEGGVDGQVNAMAVANDNQVIIGGEFHKSGNGAIDLNGLLSYNPKTAKISSVGKA